MRIIERFFPPDSYLSAEERKFSQPRTVGTCRVGDILTGQNAPFEVVFLDLKTKAEWDRSRVINRVPTGWFKKGDIAEVIVRDYKGGTFDPMSWIIRENGGFCIVAIRPFKSQDYGKPIPFTEEPYRGMFDLNIKAPNFCPAFYDKFGLFREIKK